MLDTAPENTGALQCCREDVRVYHLGVLFSKVGTVCDRTASTGVYGAFGNGRPYRD